MNDIKKLLRFYWEKLGYGGLSLLLLSLMVGVTVHLFWGILGGITALSASALLFYWLFNYPVYMAKRMVSMVAILLGVVIVTFAAVHLAPVDVPQGKGNTGFASLTPKEREAFRRTYGLHLPVFLNFHIQDRGDRITQKLQTFQNKDQVKHIKKLGNELRSLTTLTFPELPERLSQKPNPRLQELFFHILQDISAPQTPSENERSKLLVWWKAHRKNFSPKEITASVQRAVRGDAEAEKKIRWLHLRAVPALIQTLDTRNKATQARCCQTLNRLVHRSWKCGLQMPKKERLAALALWRDFYRQRELAYIDVTSWQRVTGVVTRTRFFTWFRRVLTLKFGTSRYFGRPVSHLLWERLPVTLTMGLAALLFAYAVAIPLGVLAGSHPGSPRDKTISILFMGFYCLPVFWVGMMLMTTLGGIHGPALFPHSGLSSPDPSGWPLGSPLLDKIWHLALPVFCLSYGSIALLGRYGRDAMADIVSEDYIRTAWAKGLSPRQVYWVHGLRNASLPQVHLLGLQIPYLLSGSVIVESIFDIPGIGLLAFTAIEMRDFNLLMGLISLTAVLTLVGQMFSDLLSLTVDPRTRIHRSHIPRTPSTKEAP